LENFLTFIAIPLEFIQLSTFSLNLKAEWSSKIYKATSSTVFRFPEVPVLPIFWAVIVIGSIWCLYMIPFLVKRKGVILADDLLRFNTVRTLYSIAFYFLVPFATFLFFPLVNTLLAMLSCSYWSPTQHEPHLVVDSAIGCWQGQHIWYSILALAVFLAYFPIAIYSYPKVQQMDPKLDIKYKNNFLFAVGLFKLMICVIGAMFVDFELPRIIVSVVASFCLLLFNMEMRPCNVPKLNTCRSAGLAGAVVAGACSIWALQISADAIAPLITMICVWIVILGLLIATLLGKIGISKAGGQSFVSALHEDPVVNSEQAGERTSLLSKQNNESNNN